MSYNPILIIKIQMSHYTKIYIILPQKYHGITMFLDYTTIQKLELVRFYLNKLILLFRKDALKWSKVTVKVFIML